MVKLDLPEECFKICLRFVKDKMMTSDGRSWNMITPVVKRALCKQSSRYDGTSDEEVCIIMSEVLNEEE